MKRGVVLTLALLACRTPPPTPESGPPFAFVRSGAEGGDGSSDRPFGRLEDALEAGATRLRLAPGRHAAPGAPLSRSVLLQGVPGARIAGRLEVSGSTLTVEGLWLESGLKLRSARATVRTSTLGAHGEDDALDAYRAEVALHDVHVLPGPRAGIFALNSTLTVSRSAVLGSTRRSLVGEKSQVVVDGMALDGATHASGVLRGSRGRLHGIRTSSTARVGWVFEDARFTIDHAQLRGTRHALLATNSRVALSDSRVDASRVFGIGVNTSTLAVRRCHIDTEGGGLSVVGGSPVTIHTSTVTFGRDDGLTMTGGELRVADVHFRGGAMSRDGLVLHGASTRASLKRTRIDGPSGWALVATAGPTMHVDSSTIGPSGGGVWVQDDFHGGSRLSRTLIRACFEEPGLRFDGAWVRLTAVRFDGCTVVGSRRGELQSSGAHLGGGLGLFGASRAELGGGEVAGRPWSAFCAPGTTLELDGAVLSSTVAGCRRAPTVGATSLAP